jgi:hypothetical protein
MSYVYFNLIRKGGERQTSDSSSCREVLGRSYNCAFSYSYDGKTISSKKSDWNLIFGVNPMPNIEDTDKYCKILNNDFLTGLKINRKDFAIEVFNSEKNPKEGVLSPIIGQPLLSAFLYVLRFPSWLKKVSEDVSKDDAMRAMLLIDSNITTSQRFRTLFYLYDLKDINYTSGRTVWVGPSDWLEVRLTPYSGKHHTILGENYAEFILKFKKEVRAVKARHYGLDKLVMHSYMDFYTALAFEDDEISLKSGLLSNPHRQEIFHEFRQKFLSKEAIA